MKKYRAISMCFCIIFFSSVINAQDTVKWHYPLYLSNMGYWKSRIPVEITSTSTAGISGQPVIMITGNGHGEIPLAGVEASGIRLVDGKGNELLWNIYSPEDKLITEGRVPPGSRFMMPVTVSSGQRETYYVYYDNPAAWPTAAVLEWHTLINGNFEGKSDDGPAGWRLGRPEKERHISWSREYPHSGSYCLKIESHSEAGRQNTPVQNDIYIRPGAKYHAEAWIRGSEIKGKAGYKILTGPIASADEFTMEEIILHAGGGTFGWKSVNVDFTASNDVNTARILPFVEGEGSAWFDDIKITCLSDEKISAEIRPAEVLDLSAKTENNSWPADEGWSVRVPVKILNFGNMDISGIPVYVKLEQVYLRLHGKISNSSSVMLNNKVLSSDFRLENSLLFESKIAPHSEQAAFIYFRGNEKEKVGKERYSGLYNDKRNLVKNPAAVNGDEHWKRIGTDILSNKVSMGITKKGNNAPDLYISIKERVSLKENEKAKQYGWFQDVPVESGKSYMFGAMARCEDITEGISVQVIFVDQNGKDLDKNFESDFINGTHDWTFISGIFRVPGEASAARLKITLDEQGSVFYKGMVLMEVIEGYASSMFFNERRSASQDSLMAWPANTIAKVFREDLPPVKTGTARISAARNETEPLQIAVRSPYPVKNMRVEVSSPVNSSGKELEKVSVSLPGYVPIDYPSNYYGMKVPYWYLKYPTQRIGSDGWTGFWPDPLLPSEIFDLEPNSTQPVWIEVTIPEEATPGDYTGQFKLFRNDTLVKQIPWSVHVWDFTLPAISSFGAIYDYRSPDEMPEPGPDLFNNNLSGDELRNGFLSLMAKHRISSGEINPVPRVVYKDGKAEIDFTEYDKAASYYFDELRNPFAYLPTQLFYLFGWAFPPSEKFSQKPYPGKYPYEDADRGKLTPEYKKAYQEVLRTFWEHVKEKGWADRYILYLSDEPHMAENSKADIVAQMKALCDMIHEVDAGIPIYVSTWYYRPEWDGYIDVWGVAYNGGDPGSPVPVEDLDRMVKSGDRIWFTTDGNFCTETPYMALERLLPWFGYKFGAQAYEFWGVNWLTYNPFRFGWHSYIFESQAPGEESWKRYPNGDGFVIYPGKPAGQDELIGSIRLKQVREGAEDYEYMSLLNNLISKAEQLRINVKSSKNALNQALKMVNIPCAMGRYSTKLLSDPDEIFIIRENIAKSIEDLTRQLEKK